MYTFTMVIVATLFGGIAKLFDLFGMEINDLISVKQKRKRR